MTRRYRNKIQLRTLENFMKEAAKLRNGKILNDFTLECEGELYPVHRIVLAASSPYFQDFFMKPENLQLTRMTIDFLQCKVLQVILDYFYSGTINIYKEQSPELLKNLIRASSYLQVTLLCSHCLELLLNKSINNISLADWNLIEELNSETTNKIFLKAIIKKLPTCVDSEEFLKCTPNQIVSLLSYPDISNCQQSVVLHGVVNWVKYDSNVRKEYLSNLLQNIDFNKLNSVDFSKYKDESLLLGNLVFLEACSRWMFRQLEISNKTFNKTPLINPQMMQRPLKRMSIGGCGSENISLSNCGLRDIFSHDCKKKFFVYHMEDSCPEVQIYVYNSTIKEFKELVSHPLNFVYFSAIIAYRGKIYSFGGWDRSTFVYRLVNMYNAETNEWKQLGDMRCCRYQATVVELNGYIYVAGGYTNFADTIVKCVERYDPELDKWKDLADLPLLNKQTTPMVALTDCLYTWLQGNLYKYSPTDDKWCFIETELSKKLQCEDVHMTIGNHRIFIIEKSEPRSMWIFNPSDNSVIEDIVPSVLKQCDGVLNLDNPVTLEFLVSGSGKWFVYKPLHVWIPCNPQKLERFKISTLTLLS